MDSHTPVMPISFGRISTMTIWNTKVRRKEIAADTAPLFRAVKKEDHVQAHRRHGQVVLLAELAHFHKVYKALQAAHAEQVRWTMNFCFAISRGISRIFTCC